MSARATLQHHSTSLLFDLDIALGHIVIMIIFRLNVQPYDEAFCQNKRQHISRIFM